MGIVIFLMAKQDLFGVFLFVLSNAQKRQV